MKSEHHRESRRDFIRKSILAGSLIPFTQGLTVPAMGKDTAVAPLKVHIFSKHLQFLDYRDMANAAAEIGFDGVDLTVRPKGHVEPEKVETDLPKAIEAIRKAGLMHTMMTTAVENADDATDQKVLKTAAGLGISSYRMNWFSYPKDKTIPEAITQFKKRIGALGILNRKLGLKGCYQNHSGDRAGASIWELWEMVHDADPEYVGVQYDIRHAVVEGGMSWKNGLRLIHPRIKLLAIKDFVWTKKNGTYVVENVPLGQGMVDFKSYFALLRKYNIDVPVSLHFEYDLGGAEHGGTRISVDKQVVFNAMKRDLKTLRQMWSA